MMSTRSPNFIRKLLQKFATHKMTRPMSGEPDTPGPRGPNFKLFELRTYQMNPQHYKESIDTMMKYWNVRTKYSKCVGSWMTEIGPICETVHLWEYANLSERFANQAALCRDNVWQKEYLPLLAKHSLNLTSQLLILAPGSKLTTSFKDNLQASYELHSCDLYTPVVNTQDEVVVGQFKCIYGPTPAEFILLRYTDHDLALEKAYLRRKNHSLKGYSRYLMPCPWSPLQ